MKYFVNRLGRGGSCAAISTLTVSVASFAGGCSAPRFDWRDAPGATVMTTDLTTPADYSAANARSLPMFRGDNGARMTWSGLLIAARWADVIIIGEQHDDAVGHAVQLAVIENVLAARPFAALSMEMLERDEQPVVDDYLEGIIDTATLAKLTFSESWAGEGSWKDWYQPMIDAVKAAGGRVIAANAPRRYVRLARTDGYERLKSLPADRRKLFDLPNPLSDDGYRKRFFDLMSEGEPAHGTPDSSGSGFRSQQVWDATMAASIVRALQSRSFPVIHVVGQFHCDFNGGLVQQIRSRTPRAKILVISMQRDDARSMREEDRHRADIIIYTGPPPPEPTPKVAPEAAPTPAESAAPPEPPADDDGGPEAAMPKSF